MSAFESRLRGYDNQAISALLRRFAIYAEDAANLGLGDLSLAFVNKIEAIEDEIFRRQSPPAQDSDIRVIATARALLAEISEPLTLTIDDEIVDPLDTPRIDAEHGSNFDW